MAGWEPKIYKGASYIRPFTHRDPRNRQPINLTGKNIRITFSGIFSSPLVLATNLPATTNGSQLEFTDASLGAYELTLTAADTALAIKNRGQWFLERIDELGEALPLGRGQVVIR